MTADKRLLEDGTSFRLLEDDTSFRLLEEPISGQEIRVSQAAIEIVYDEEPGPTIRVSQAAVEIVYAETPGPVIRASQASIEYVYSSSPTITSTCPLPEAEVGVPYSFQLEATGGGGGPYTWVITSGTLPDGLTMDSSGLISGTPTVSGGFSIVVSVTG